MYHHNSFLGLMQTVQRSWEVRMTQNGKKETRVGPQCLRTHNKFLYNLWASPDRKKQCLCLRSIPYLDLIKSTNNQEINLPSTLMACIADTSGNVPILIMPAICKTQSAPCRALETSASFLISPTMLFTGMTSVQSEKG